MSSELKYANFLSNINVIVPYVKYARPNVTKYQVDQFFLCRRKIYTSSRIFLCQVENLYIKFITLSSVANYFSEKNTYL